MFTVVITEKGGAQRRMEFDKNEVTIGRVQGNDIILPKGNVSKRHSRIVLKDNRFIVVDLKSTNGTYVNGRKITSPLVVKGGDKIYIGDFILTLDEAGAMAAAGGGAPSQPAPPPGAFAEPPPMPSGPPMGAQPPPPMPPQAEPRRAPPPLRSQPPPPMPGMGGPAPAPMPSARAAAPPPLPSRGGGGDGAMHARGPMQSEPAPPMATAPQQAVSPGDRFALDEEPSEDGPAPIPRVSPAPVGRPRADSAGRMQQAQAMDGRGMEAPRQRSGPVQIAPAPVPPMPQPAPPMQQPAPPVMQARSPSRPAVVTPAIRRVQLQPAAPGDVDASLRSVMTRLQEAFDTANPDAHLIGDQQRWQDAQHAIQGTIGQLQGEGLIDPQIDRERLAGAALREAVGLGTLEALLQDERVREIVVEAPNRIVADLGNGLEPVPGSFSSADAVLVVARRLLAQAGVTLDPAHPVHEAMLPDGVRVLVVMPPVALRGPVIELRRSARVVQPQDLVDRGYLSNDMLELLRTAVRGRRNILVSGAIGAGVTTLLAGIAGLTSETERLVTVEDVPDLAIPRRHVIGLSTGGPRGLTLRQVLQQANRLRCDRMVIDDVRGDEARDVLVTMASRRDGTLVGVHAPTAQDALGHLELLARLESGAASAAVRQLISEAVHLLVQVSRLEDGTRRVTAVTEVVGLRDGQIETQDLYVWQDEFLSTGNEPRFLRG